MAKKSILPILLVGAGALVLLGGLGAKKPGMAPAQLIHIQTKEQYEQYVRMGARARFPTVMFAYPDDINVEALIANAKRLVDEKGYFVILVKASDLAIWLGKPGQAMPMVMYMESPTKIIVKTWEEIMAGTPIEEPAASSPKPPPTEEGENPYVPFDDLREVQQALAALGFDIGPSGADGDWGPSTSAAVLKFQQWVPVIFAVYDLPQTGQIDAYTMSLLGDAIELLNDGKWVAPGNVPTEALKPTQPAPTEPTEDLSAEDILGYLPRNVFEVYSTVPDLLGQGAYGHAGRFHPSEKDRIISLEFRILRSSLLRAIEAVRNIAIEYPDVLFDLVFDWYHVRSSTQRLDVRFFEWSGDAPWRSSSFYRFSVKHSDPVQEISMILPAVAQWAPWLRGETDIRPNQ